MASAVDIHSETLMIPSDTAGISLQLHHKRPAKLPCSDAAHTILMMHGATYSSGSLYDTAIEGFSFLDFLAGQGYNVYAVDVRGYGGASRPIEMDQPAHLSSPVVDTEVGIRDFASAVEFVLHANDIRQLNVIGMSWGGTVTGAYTAANADKVRKLGLIAPQWLSSKPIALDTGGVLNAYRLVDASAARERWVGAAPADKQETLIPPGGFQAWLDNTVATEPDADLRAQQTIRASNGPIADIRVYWAAGKPFYDPADIRVPLLLVHGEWDIDVPLELAQAYFIRASHAPSKRWIEIGEATHMLVLEKNRLQAFRSLAIFFQEKP